MGVLAQKGGKKPKKPYCPGRIPYSYNKQWPLPATGDFQVVGAMDAGVDGGGARGVATGTIQVPKINRKLITFTAEKKGFGLCGESEPASLVLKLLKTTVFKREFGGKGKKDKKKDKDKKAMDKIHSEFANPLDTEGFCMTKMSAGKKACLMGQKLWKKTYINVNKRFQLGPVPLSAAIKLHGKYGADYGIGFLDDCTGAAAKRAKNKKKKKELSLMEVEKGLMHHPTKFM